MIFEKKRKREYRVKEVATGEMKETSSTDRYFKAAVSPAAENYRS